jgi:protein tyrosine phosphatase (PTP) superfamily phosphohydrolase (DUF442 family)
VLARLDGIPGVAESRVDRSGRRFLLTLDPGADEAGIAREARSELGSDAEVLDPDAEAALLASRRRGELWVTADETIRLSREEASILAARFGEESAREIGLDAEKTRQLVAVLEREVAAAFERFHGRSDALKRFRDEQPAISARVLEASRSFLTDAELASLRAFVASKAPEPEADKCEPPPAAPEAPLLPRADLPGLPNFARISDALYRGAQPTAEGMRELEKLGVKTVVNLRSFHSDRDELRGTGLRYAHIECKAWHPEEEDVVRFLAILRDPANQPVFVHCQHGADRTGMMVASYRVVEQGWTTEQATEELPRFGFHEVWDGIREFLAKLDPAALERKVEQAPVESLEVVR